MLVSVWVIFKIPLTGGVAWVRIPLETFIFILNFSPPTRSKPLSGVHVWGAVLLFISQMWYHLAFDVISPWLLCDITLELSDITNWTKWYHLIIKVISHNFDNRWYHFEKLAYIT